MNHYVKTKISRLSKTGFPKNFCFIDHTFWKVFLSFGTTTHFVLNLATDQNFLKNLGWTYLIILSWCISTKQCLALTAIYVINLKQRKIAKFSIKSQRFSAESFWKFLAINSVFLPFTVLSYDLFSIVGLYSTWSICEHITITWPNTAIVQYDRQLFSTHLELEGTKYREVMMMILTFRRRF